MPSYSGVWNLTAVYQAVAQGLWSYPPAFSVGPQANVVSAQLQAGSVGKLSSSAFIYAYNTTTDIYAVVGTISGSAITFGTPVLIRSGLSPQGVCVSCLSSTSALVTFGNASSVWAGVALSISGTTITAGSITANGSLTTSIVVCKPLTSTTALCIAQSTNLKASVATISGTSVTWGSTVDLNSSGVNYPTLSSSSSTTAIAGYIPFNGVNNGKPCAVAMTISGSTITPGAETVLDSSQSGSAWAPGICALSTTSAVFAYGNSANSYLKAVAMSISGTTVTPGSPTSTLTAYDANPYNADAGHMITALDSSRALLVTRKNGVEALGQVLTVSGSTVTSGQPETILGTTSRAVSVEYLGSNLAVAGYGDSTTTVSARVLQL